jgi:hypothetical protein
MGLPREFNDAIESKLNVFAAWLPIANVYELGDYGIIADGVFAKMGNIKEFDVAFTEGTGNDTSIDFTSANTKVINFAAGAQVNVIPDGAANAKVTFKFDKERSFMIKSPSINVKAIQNVNEVGNKLMDHPKWELRFKVVYQTYFAKEPAIFSTIDAGTEITFTGDVKALQQLSVGSTSLQFSSTSKLGLQLQGKEGIIALGLFQIVKKGFLKKKKNIEVLLSGENELAKIEPEDVEDDL